MSNFEEIIQKLTEIQEQDANDEKQIEYIRLRQDEIRKKKEELHKLLDDVTKQEWTLKEAASAVRVRRRDNEREIESLRRAKSRAEKDEQLAREFKEKSDFLDSITAGAPWREWAFDHQISGAKQLAIAGRGILGDKRGLGKTLTSIIWLDMNKVKKAIIFVPKEAATAFRKQMPKWAPHRPLFDCVAQPPRIRNAFLESLQGMEEYNILINLEAWRKDKSILQKLIELQPEAVIIDEAHSIKDPKTSMFKGVKTVIYPDEFESGGRNPLVIPSVRHVLPMSGTSYLNYPDELWSLLNLVDRSAWPDKRSFQYDYLQQDGYTGRWVFNKYSGAEERLINELGIRFVQRDRKAAGVVIPPQEIVYHEIEWDTEKYYEQYQAYRDLEIKCAILLENMEESAVMGVEGFALFTRLRQMISWPAGIELKDPKNGQVLLKCNVEQSIKIDSAVDLLEQIKEEEDRCVVFSQFRAPLRETKRRLDELGIKSVILDGDTPPRLREEVKVDFDAQQTDEHHYKWDVVLANYKVGGQSLDFTAARQMICIEQEWNPGRNEQAYGRIDRIGQTRETVVHVLQVIDTYDEEIQKINSRKAAGINSFEEGIKAGVAYLKRLRGN